MLILQYKFNLKGEIALKIEIEKKDALKIESEIEMEKEDALKIESEIESEMEKKVDL